MSIKCLTPFLSEVDRRKQNFFPFGLDFYRGIASDRPWLFAGIFSRTVLALVPCSLLMNESKQRLGMVRMDSEPCEASSDGMGISSRPYVFGAVC
jgi:hypothetical protein